jgi:hypothetical protein
VRIVVGLVPDAEWTAVAAALRDAGAADVRPPLPSLPDVVLAEFPQGDAEAVAARVAALPGVRYAEPDTLSSGFG